MPKYSVDNKKERVWNFIQYGARQHVMRDLGSVCEKMPDMKKAPVKQAPQKNSVKKQVNHSIN